MKLKSLAAGLALLVVAAAPAEAQLTGRGLTWQYWAYGGAYNLGGSPASFIGGSCAPSFYNLDICTTDNTITFDYTQAVTWSPSGNSHGIINNGISVFYNDAGPNDLFTLSINPATNLAGFTLANIALVGGNEVQVEWTGLTADVNTIVVLDLTPSVVATPEPASLALMGTGLLGVLGGTYRRRKRAASL